MPQQVKKCTNLRSINLSSNPNLNADSTFIVLIDLPLISDLKISVDSIEQIPLQYINIVTGITIKNNNLKSFPVKALNFPNLTYLNVSGTKNQPNTFDSLPSELFNKTELATLVLEYCNITYISTEIGKLSNLTTLKLEGNNLIELPEEIKNLKKLHVIGIENNKFQSLPTSICALNKLQILCCYNNSISELPPEIKGLTSLEALYFWNNNIHEIPDEICYLENLKDLRLYKNQLNDVNPQIACLNNLAYLDLSYNNIEAIPEEIESLVALKFLYMENNQISVISFSNSNLIELNLNNNQINTLTPDIQNFSNLKVLSLNNNNLSILPSEIVNLQNINQLDLQNNNISSLPNGLETMLNLQYIDVNNNPLPPSELNKLQGINGIIISSDNLSNSQTTPKVNFLPEFADIAAGSFKMGNNKIDVAKPAHKVELSGFEVSKHEITVSQFCYFLNDYGSVKIKDGVFEGYLIINNFSWAMQISGDSLLPVEKYKDHPVLDVTWYGAMEYCKWLSNKTGNIFRLPTEAEWEYVAGGGQNNRTDFFGTSETKYIGNYSWFAPNSQSMPHPVGTKQPNSLEVYDMSGNVAEWCYDWIAVYDKGSQKNPINIRNGFEKVVRGGSWEAPVHGISVYIRKGLEPQSSSPNVGFRIVKTN